jgi:hypothetical protein
MCGNLGKFLVADRIVNYPLRVTLRYHLGSLAPDKVIEGPADLIHAILEDPYVLSPL